MTIWDFDQYQVKLITFMFILMRISGAFLMAPVFGSSQVFGRLKIWFAFFVSLAILPAVPSMHRTIENLSIPLFFFYAIKEVTVGVILGFLTNMPFLATRVGAEIAGRMSGFGMAKVINPDVDENTLVLSNFIYIIVVLLFLNMNGHHLIIKLASLSFDYIPIGKNILSQRMSLIVAELFAFVFNKGITYGAVVLGMLIIVSTCMGILGKVVPEMNLMIFALPMRVAIGLIGTMLTFPFLNTILRHLISFTEKCSHAIIQQMSGGTA